MKSGLVAAALMLAAESGSAATLYDCTMDGKGHGGDWVPNRMVILYDEAKKSAKVSDQAILHFVGAPVDAKVAGDTAEQLTLVWELRVTDRQQSAARMQYRATWLKKAKMIKVSANALQYGQVERRQGKCALKTVK